MFQVFDRQDSGNLGFGVDTGSEWLFVKYAGARPAEYAGDPAEAVERLKQAVPVYDALGHPGLVEMRDHFPVAKGYAMVYSWFPGECLHAPWAFSPEEKYTHPESPSCRFRRLPLAQRLEAFGAILAFHEHVSRAGYVAIDFYDGSILYDFSHHATMVCDIDFYAKRPYVNTMGRMWGSSRFMSPEEHAQGAEIDEVTNVFTMGATAFALLGGDRDRSRERWDGCDATFEVAAKAISPDRSRRYPTLSALSAAWHMALQRTGSFQSRSTRCGGWA